MRIKLLSSCGRTQNIDFSKAFDVVIHDKLFIRLYSYGICGELFSWLKCMYIGRTHCTKVGDVLSDEADMIIISGVIQGSVIGPMMFLVFINELLEILDSYVLRRNGASWSKSFYYNV